MPKTPGITREKLVEGSRKPSENKIKCKKIKKVVDRLGKICYYNQAACEKENKKRELAAAKKQQTEP